MTKNTFKNSFNKDSGNNTKIELLKCPRAGENCHTHLSDINNSYAESVNYQQIKEYQLSIQSLKLAYSKTHDLKGSARSQCARFFRTKIIDSLEQMHNDLHNMSNSFFRGKRYHNSYVMAKTALWDLKSTNV